MSLHFRWRKAAIVAIVAGWFVWTSALPEMRMFQTTFHIDKGNPACIDAGGSGTEAVPYCTMAYAATIANPGQTFLVHGPKHGDAPITFTRPGTLAQPITWRAVGYVALSRHVDVNDAAFTPSGLGPNVYQLPWTTAGGKAWQTFFPDIVVDDPNQTYFILKDEDGPMVMTSVLTEAELIAHDGTYFRDAANQRMLVHPYGNVTPSNTATDFVVAVGNALTIDTKANYQIFDGFTITYTTGTSAQVLSSNNKLYNMHYVGQPLDIRGQTNYGENITINHGIWREGPLWEFFTDGAGSTGGFSLGTGHVMKNLHVFNSWNSTFNSEGTVGNTIDGGRFHGAPNHCTAAGNGNHTIRNVAWWNCQDYQWLYDPAGITMEHVVIPGGGVSMSAIEGNIGPITIRNSIFKGTVQFVRGTGTAAGLPYDGCTWEAGSLMEYNVIASDATIERCDTQISYKIDEYVARCASGEFTGCMTIRNNIKVSPSAWNTVMVDGMWPVNSGVGPNPLGEQWNFQLVPGSPAINAGMVSGATTDLIGISRPQPVGGLYDIGAYEFTPGGDPAPTGKPIVAAPAAVTTTITAPTSAATYDAGTSATLTTLAGTSKSGRTITGCTWVNSLGGSGSTSGTTSWTIASVALTVGSNVITVTCTNDGKTTGADVITVTRSSGGGGATREVGAGQTHTTIQACLNVAVAGDTCNVHTGTYTEQLTLQSSGTSGSRITLKNNASDVVTVQSTSSPVLNINSRSYWTVQGIRLTYNGSGSDPKVINHNYSGVNVNPVNGLTFNNLILTMAGGTGGGFVMYIPNSDALTVTGTTLQVTSTTGSHDGADFLYSSNLEFSGNTMFGNASETTGSLEDGLVVTGTNINIENNVLHDGWRYDSHPDGIIFQGDGDRLGNQSANISIVRNTVYNFTQGIYFDAIHNPLEGNNLVANNVVYETSAFRYGGLADKMNCIVIDGERLAGAPHFAVDVGVYNNTLDCGQINVYNVRVGTGSNLNIRNNIFIGSYYTGIWIEASGTILNYNHYAGADSTPVRWLGAAISLATLQSTYGQEVNRREASIATLDLNANYTPKSTSDSNNRGVSLSATFTDDRLGLTRTGTWDMGAYEYGATPPAPAPLAQWWSRIRALVQGGN